MTIPFLDYFKKKSPKEKAFRPSPKATAYAPVEKPSGEKLSKTVMPNTTRTVSPQDPYLTPSSPSLVGVAAPVMAPGRPTISFGGSASMARAADLPPAVALALEPRVERTVSLELAEVVRQMPEGTVRPLEEANADRRILLKASELERGMAEGNPSVSLATIYQQVPEIFLRTIAADETTQVQIPFEKVLEQFSKLHVRNDQNRAQAVPQMETPFLQVTLEDNTRFGVTGEPLGGLDQTQMLEDETDALAAAKSGSDLPPVRMELATAETLAAAEPEATASERFFPTPVAQPVRVKIKPPKPSGYTNGATPAPAVEKPQPDSAVEKSKPAALPVEQAKSTPAPARIPFSFSPKETDVPVPERVPASSGPSVSNNVPASTPAPAQPAAPARIPFKMSAPGAETPGTSEPWLMKEEVKIALALKPILASLPPLQIKGDVSGVPEEARIEIPFSLIEPQLASGRVLLQPDVFSRHLPEAYRDLFNASDVSTTVSLPLQDVLKNLPTTSLQMRGDQVEQDKGANFATPFSAKAEEDAERFKTVAPAAATAPAPAQTPTPAPTPIVLPKPAPTVMPPLSVLPPVVAEKQQSAPALQKEAASPVSAPDLKMAREGDGTAPLAGTRSALQSALDTDDEVDAKAVVAHVEKMAGVKACAIMFGDGLSLAGNLPEMYEADGLCAMAPSLLHRIENHMNETKLGALRAVTLSCSQAAVTFFMHDNLCLAALHTKEELASDVRERLARAVHELSRKYSHPAKEA